MSRDTTQAQATRVAEFRSIRSRRPASGPRRPGSGLLATFGRHRPGRPATLRNDQTMKTSGLRPEPRPSSEMPPAAHLAGHHKGYQPPRTGTRSFVRQGRSTWSPSEEAGRSGDCPTRRSAKPACRRPRRPAERKTARGNRYRLGATPIRRAVGVATGIQACKDRAVLTSSASPPVAVLLFFELFGIAAIALGIGIIVTRRVPWPLQGLAPLPLRRGSSVALIGVTIVLGASAEFPSTPHPVAVALTAAAFVTVAASVACLIFVRR
ncbi:hypothetical protein GA0070613_1661 [Micromonospora inositola]|uniref:Uncharacterized protein n=1 Tax=Micromonospora inositola TaxID=47865 RepID=A0A1C5HQA1_9ACTN|nr:hypothetical protein GA0070613_1661 [Micromonospora inositola]